MAVPFFRPKISESAIAEVAECLRSGWLTTGPRVKEFERRFATAVGAEHAVAVNSCTAALHLAIEALGLTAGQAVLVPTLTFASTAEVVTYRGGIPILVDCDPKTFHIDLADAERKLQSSPHSVVGIVPVHVGGLMIDLDQLQGFADRHGLWVVEDAAHAFPASYRADANSAWRRCGEDTAAVTCYSFYANKTITTGEGGMAVTADADVAARMRQMSLHGLSNDAWKRYQGGVAWDYRIVAPGYKYNLTDIAAAIGLHQLERAEAMRLERQGIAGEYDRAFADLEQLELPVHVDDRIHAWHLYPVRLCLDRLAIDRNSFVQQLREAEVGCSVHWRPLHLHPYYGEELGWREEDCPQASEVWPRLVTLPLFPGMLPEEKQRVIEVVRQLCKQHAR